MRQWRSKRSSDSPQRSVRIAHRGVESLRRRQERRSGPGARRRSAAAQPAQPSVGQVRGQRSVCCPPRPCDWMLQRVPDRPTDRAAACRSAGEGRADRLGERRSGRRRRGGRPPPFAVNRTPPHCSAVPSERKKRRAPLSAQGRQSSTKQRKECAERREGSESNRRAAATSGDRPTGSHGGRWRRAAGPTQRVSHQQ